VVPNELRQHAAERSTHTGEQHGERELRHHRLALRAAREHGVENDVGLRVRLVSLAQVRAKDREMAE
jgi:hypothetical protein